MIENGVRVCSKHGTKLSSRMQQVEDGMARVAYCHVCEDERFERVVNTIPRLDDDDIPAYMKKEYGRVVG